MLEGTKAYATRDLRVDESVHESVGYTISNEPTNSLCVPMVLSLFPLFVVYRRFPIEQRTEKLLGDIAKTPLRAE